MFSASPIWPLTRRISATRNVQVSAAIGVPVRGETRPIQRGARPSSASMMAMRDGTSIVAFTDVERAMIAPMVTSIAAPRGGYCAAGAAIGAAAVRSCEAGGVREATCEIMGQLVSDDA